jgi:predicted Holliday junction resolvase-like endonuclease
MADFDTTIIHPTDRIVVDLFKEIQEVIGSASEIKVAGLSNSFAVEDDTLKQILKNNLSTIHTAASSARGISVRYYAKMATDGSHLKPHPYYSTIRVSIGDNPRPDDSLILSLQTTISKFIIKKGLSPTKLATMGDIEIAPNVAVLSAIQASASDQIARVNDFFAELTERFDERNLRLEESYRERVEKLQEQFATKENALKAEREALEARKKELDDRDNTHARRAIRGELIQTIQERQKSFTISPETRELRWPIHFVFFLLLLGTFSGAVWSLYVWGANPNDSWGAMTITSALKTAVFAFGFLTSAGLYISWMNRWFDKHADAQFHTKQFEIDINRATWAVEAALEWKNIQGEQMPDALLTGITKHLFDHTPGEVAE